MFGLVIKYYEIKTNLLPNMHKGECLILMGKCGLIWGYLKKHKNRKHPQLSNYYNINLPLWTSLKASNPSLSLQPPPPSLSSNPNLLSSKIKELILRNLLILLVTKLINLLLIWSTKVRDYHSFLKQGESRIKLIFTPKTCTITPAWYKFNNLEDSIKSGNG